MFDLLAALTLAPVVPAATNAQLPAAPWWERITMTMNADGQPQGCSYTSSTAAASSDCTAENTETGATSSGEHSASKGGKLTRITYERRFTPGATPAAADAEVQAGDTLLGREVLALAIDGHGSVRNCKVVARSGDVMVDYGCAEAQAERFQASASRGDAVQRQGYMTVLIYGHDEHVA
ncbi:hypothetical protein ACUXST_002312 [Sphingomonas sp. F9_3S_D5_B_2]